MDYANYRKGSSKCTKNPSCQQERPIGWSIGHLVRRKTSCRNVFYRVLQYNLQVGECKNGIRSVVGFYLNIQKGKVTILEREYYKASDKDSKDGRKRTI